jgi:hypothetical protein
MNRMTLPDREPANTAGSTAQDTGWASTIALGGFILVATAPTLIDLFGGVLILGGVRASLRK